VAQLHLFWQKFKAHFQTTIRWIATTATIGNFVTLTWVGLSALIGGLIALDLMRDVVTIEPISVPKALSDNGYTPEVAGHRLRDALNSYGSRSRSGPFSDEANSYLNLDLNIADRDELPDFVVPQIGLSLSAIVSSIRSVLHSRSRPSISGEIVFRDKFALRIRIDGSEVYSSGFDSDNPDELMAGAASAVLEKIKPSLNAIVLYGQNREQSLLKAEEIIASLRASDINVQWAYLLKGNAALDKGKYADAEQMYRKAISLNRSNPQPHIQLGLALEGQGSFDEAIKEFQRVIAIDPKSANAYNNIGAVLVKKAALGKATPDKAIEAYRRAIAVDPSYALSYNNLGLVLYKQGDTNEAIAKYGQAIQIDPKYLFAHWNLAYALQHEVKLDDALAEYRAAIECTNDRRQLAILHTSVGDILKQKASTDGNIDGAIAEYRHATRIDPDYYWAHNNLGLIWLDQGRTDDAIAEFRSATKTYPEIEGIRDNLTRALQEKQGKKDAGAPQEASALKE
jgi:tetratricopeptide (TPR) repeat protein